MLCVILAPTPAVLHSHDTYMVLPYKYHLFFCIQFITNEQVKLVSFTWEGPISRFLILAVPLSLYVIVAGVNIVGVMEWRSIF